MQVEPWVTEPLPAIPTTPFRVALVAVWIGPLPAYIDYFSAAAATSAHKGVS